jgi:2-polyprenyl-6-hydroxyphenyl methylase/3-demethylubiquinone-9 3-methyltransferase
MFDGRKLVATLIVVLAFVWTFIKSPVLNDLKIYDDVDWWNMDTSPFLGLLRSNAVRLPIFLKDFPETEDKANVSVLDVGCGGGYLSEAVAELGYNVSGIDPSESSIFNAKIHANKSELEIDYRVCSAFEICYLDNTFDVVIASDVLEHVGDVAKALAEIHRVLKPGGKLVFDCINRSFRAIYFVWFVMQELLGIIPKGAHDWRLFVTPVEMEAMLTVQGFATDRTVWVGRHWNYSYLTLLLEGRKKFIHGMYVDADLSEFYMGSASKNNV